MIQKSLKLWNMCVGPKDWDESRHRVPDGIIELLQAVTRTLPGPANSLSKHYAKTLNLKGAFHCWKDVCCIRLVCGKTNIFLELVLHEQRKPIEGAVEISSARRKTTTATHWWVLYLVLALCPFWNKIQENGHSVATASGFIDYWLMGLDYSLYVRVGDGILKQCCTKCS